MRASEARQTASKVIEEQNKKIIDKEMKTILDSVASLSSKGDICMYANKDYYNKTGMWVNISIRLRDLGYSIEDCGAWWKISW